LRATKKTVDSYEILITHLKSDLPYSESLAVHFSVVSNWNSPFFNYSAYETLKTRGVELISNKALRLKIIRMFERELIFLVEDYDKSEWGYANSVVHSLVTKHLEDTSDTTSVPNNYIQLKNDPTFRNTLAYLIVMRKSGIESSNELKNSLKQLIFEVIQELEKM